MYYQLQTITDLKYSSEHAHTFVGIPCDGHLFIVHRYDNGTFL